MLHELHRVVGTGSFAQSGATIEEFKWLKVSPSGGFVAAYSHEIGTSGYFTDHNIKVFDLNKRTLVEQFNEHSFSADRASCTSTVFDQHYDELRDIGYTDADLTAMDYELDNEETKERLGVPEFYWLTDDSFVVWQHIGVLVSGSPTGSFSGSEEFTFLFAKTVTGWDGPKACNQSAGSPAKAEPSAIRIGPSNSGLPHQDKVHAFVRSRRIGRKPKGNWFPLPFGPRRRFFWFQRKSRNRLLSAVLAAGPTLPKRLRR